MASEESPPRGESAEGEVERQESAEKDALEVGAAEGEPAEKKSVLGIREAIGIISPSERSNDEIAKRLTKQEQALREAIINRYQENKVQEFIAEQVDHVNAAEQISEGIRFLFDKEGRPPANMPLEEVIAERKRIESQFRWLEAICAELRNSLVRIREIENLALDLLDLEGDDGKGR